MQIVDFLKNFVEHSIIKRENNRILNLPYKKQICRIEIRLKNANNIFCCNIVTSNKPSQMYVA